MKRGISAFLAVLLLGGCGHRKTTVELIEQLKDQESAQRLHAIKELEQRSGGLYRASAGTVYPTLQQLEDEKLLCSEVQDGRKLYTLTAEGLQEIEREKETIDRIWRRAERWGDWGRWSGPESFAFFRPLAALVKATFRAAKWAAGDSQREERLLGVLEKTIQQLDELRKE